MGMVEDDMSEGKINRNLIKDKSLKHQVDYCRSFHKEVGQEASFKRKNWGSDSKRKLGKCVNNTMTRLQKEGLIKEVSGFLKHGLKLKGI